MLAVVSSAAISGIDALPVQVEVNHGEAGDPRWILRRQTEWHVVR